MAALSLASRFSDLIACAGVAAVGIALTALGPVDALRVLVGLSLVALVPGYALGSFLWGPRSRLTTGDRVAFSVGLSISLTVLTLLLLSFLGGAIVPLAIASSLGGLTIVLSVAGMARRAVRHEGLPPEIVKTLRRGLAGYRQDRVFWSIVGIILAGLLVLAAATVTVPPPPLATALYVTGPDHTVGTLPRNLSANATAALIVGVHNGAATDVSFTLSICLSSNNSTCVGSGTSASWTSVVSLEPGASVVLGILVAPGATAENTLSFSVPLPGRYMLSLTLDSGGYQGEDHLPLTVR